MQRGPFRNGSAVVDHEFYRLAPGPDPARFLSSERELARTSARRAGDRRLPLCRVSRPARQHDGWLDFGRAGRLCELAWSVTLTGMVVRLFVVSRLLLSGLPLVARGWQEPSDDGWTNGLAGLLPRKRASLSRARLLACSSWISTLRGCCTRAIAGSSWSRGYFFGGALSPMTCLDHAPAVTRTSPPHLRVGLPVRVQRARRPAWSR